MDMDKIIDEKIKELRENKIPEYRSCFIKLEDGCSQCINSKRASELLEYDKGICDLANMLRGEVKIKKLEYYSLTTKRTDFGVERTIASITNEQLMDKINEIIDVINKER